MWSGLDSLNPSLPSYSSLMHRALFSLARTSSNRGHSPMWSRSACVTSTRLRMPSKPGTTPLTAARVSSR